MTVLEALREEIRAPKNGECIREILKGEVLLANADASAPEKRAAVCAYLLNAREMHIYRNDWIVGSMRSHFTDYAPENAEECRRISAEFGERTFITNADHFAPDYWYTLERGVPGLIGDINASVQAHGDEPDCVLTLTQMRRALEGLLELIRNTRRKAEALLNAEGYCAERLNFIIGNLAQLELGAPQTFAQALQLVWLCHTCFQYEGRYAMALGRMDSYLLPFYERDIAEGTLTPERATEFLANAFLKIHEQQPLYGRDDVVNICIGGTSLEGKCEINALSYCILHAVRDCNVPGPNLSARISAQTPEDFLDDCLQTIGTGLGYPALMNDEVIIPAMLRYGYDRADVYNYCMVGCIENFLPGKQPAWSDGRFDTPRFFEFLFNRGIGIADPNGRGVDTGDVSEISSMEMLMAKFEEQLRFGVQGYVRSVLERSTLAHPEEYTSPFLSCFCRECIARGRDINLGGTKYRSAHGAALMGVGTTADALAAIEQTVFVDHTATLTQIGDALRTNFADAEPLRRLLQKAPKYGNDDPFADRYAQWFTEFLTREFDRYRTYDGGRFVTLMAANTSNIWAGRQIAATPDGRLAGTPLSDAASPSYGKDICGPTATLKSVSRPDYKNNAGGTVVNQKYSPEMFRDGNRQKLQALIRTYFAMGGEEIQINATSPEVLRDAMAHPEAYQNLVVRVSGFSAFYVRLDRAVQLDILQRTQQQLA